MMYVETKPYPRVISAGDEPGDVIRRAIELAVKHGEADAVLEHMLGGETYGIHIVHRGGEIEATIVAAGDNTLEHGRIKETCGDPEECEVALRTRTLGDVELDGATVRDVEVVGVEDPVTRVFYAVASGKTVLPLTSIDEAAEKLRELYERLSSIADEYFEKVVVVKRLQTL